MKLPPLPAYQPYARTQQPPPPPYMVTTMNHHPYHSSPPPSFPPPNHHRPAYSRASSYPPKRIVLNPQLLLLILFFLLASCVFLAYSLPTGNNNNNEVSIQYPATSSNNRVLRTIYGTEECNVLLETERRIKEDLMEQVRRLEADASELRLKNRELESDYRELSLSARAAAAVTVPQNNKPMEDVSAVQRLAKCRSSLEESSTLIKELRDGNKQVNSQVTRLQKELREAIADADEQEAIAVACQKKTKSL